HLYAVLLNLLFIEDFLLTDPFKCKDFLLYLFFIIIYFICDKTELLGLLHCNEVDQHRHDWLLKTLESYVPPAQLHLLSVTHLDRRSIGSMRPGAYDKVLVDAPCSNDRSWLYTPDTNQGKIILRKRKKKVLQVPKQYYAISKAVRPGGVVVYSTRTMSRAKNQSVVEAMLAFYQGVELLEMEQHLIDSLSDHFCFAHFHPSVGQLVIPQKGKTWGPMYVSRLRRIYKQFKNMVER
uniref:NOP2/Sun RNA methyltransferase 3 n=1 Tax=Cyprinus carpio carpio TaxID=630221 RepID=A0A9J8BN73_CYPCA